MLTRTECAGRAAQKRLGQIQIAKLRHGNATQCECRRITTQGNAIERAQRVTRRQGTARCRDQSVHLNRVTIVTLTPENRSLL